MSNKILLSFFLILCIDFALIGLLNYWDNFNKEWYIVIFPGVFSVLSLLVMFLAPRHTSYKTIYLIVSLVLLVITAIVWGFMYAWSHTNWR
jgi:hypothetical protein